MNIVIGSAFRNSAGNAMKYFLRVAELQRSLGPDYPVRVIAVEGDSKDHTREALIRAAQEHGVDLYLVTCNHGQREFGSTEDKDRMAALSQVGNAIFSGVLPSDDLLIYVEQDLLWEPRTFVSLIVSVVLAEFQVVAPYIAAGEHFYDVWGFRHLDGQRFSPFFKPGGLPFEVSSVGSCLAMPAYVAIKTRIEDDNCLVGWCRSARALGYKIAIDPSLIVRHPA